MDIYKDYEVYGPYDSGGNAKGRQHVILIHKITRKRKTTDYARYLMECHLGYELSSQVEVDHKDGNPLNNALDNLQVLDKTNHRQKDPELKRRAKWVTLKCSGCGGKFERKQSTVNSYFKHHNKSGMMFCSKRCNGLINH